MFEKLVAVLPYNPGLAHQLSFYAKRMREEAAIRRVGVMVIVLAFFIQFFAVLSPPQPTVAASSNDLINGGISSAADAKRNCQSNVQHYGDILNYYGISCADVGGASTVTLHSTDAGNQYFSMGHLPYGARNPNSGKVTGEVPINIPGAGRVYVRHLSSFDTGRYSSYKALKFRSSVTGKLYYILYSCGNLVAIGIPAPVHICKYNSDLLASSPRCFAPCKYNKDIPADSSKCYQPCKYDRSISSSNSRCVAPCKYNKDVASNSPLCFAPCPIPGKGNLPQSSPKCFEPCPYNSQLSSNNAQCFPPCQYNKSISANSPECIAPCQYNNSLPSNSEQCFAPCQYNKHIPSSSPECFQPCPYNNAIPSSDSACKPCDKGISSQDTIACVEVHKTASNTTAGSSDANNTTANPGDVIVYSLFAQNTGKTTVKGFVFQENLSDVLDYADITDLHGGTIDTDHLVSWPGQDIPAGRTISEQITVKVKDPVPQTPVSASDPGHFDLIMTNVYGNTININLPGSPPKSVEAAAATLPNTGPGTSLFIAATIVMIAGYFYGRARLLAKESVLAIQDTTAAI